VAKKKLGDKYDRRRKLTDMQKDRIMLERTNGESVSVLAKKYGVSQSMIYFVCNPETYKKSRERASEWNRLNNPNRKDSAKRTYIYKRGLVIKGLI
jgi:transposase-like protein